MMATSRFLSDYPPSYFSLMLCAATRSISITAPDGEANRLRSRLYAFRESLLSQAYLAPRTALMASLVRIRVEPDLLILEPAELFEPNIEDAICKSRTPKTSSLNSPV